MLLTLPLISSAIITPTQSKSAHTPQINLRMEKLLDETSLCRTPRHRAGVHDLPRLWRFVGLLILVPFPVGIICSNTGLVTNLPPWHTQFHPKPGASLPAREGLGVIIVMIGVTDGRVPSSL